MASFIEEATLVLDDRATKNANRINKAMAQLDKTAKRLKATLDSIKDIKKLDVKIAGLDRAMSDAKKLDRTLSGLRDPKPINIRMDGAASAARAIAGLERRLDNLDSKAISPKVRINTTDAVDKLAALKRTADFAVTSKVKLDTDAAEAKLRGLKDRSIDVKINAIMDKHGTPVATQRLYVDHDSFGRGVGRYAREWGVQAGEEIARRIARAVAEAIAQQDAAKAATTALTTTDEEAAAIQRESRVIASTTLTTNDAQIQQLMNENLGTAKGDRTMAAQMTAEQAKLVDALVAQRESVDKATDSVKYYDKILDLRGKLVDKEGKLDAEAARRRRLLAATDIVGGTDVTGNTMVTAMRNAGSQQKTMSDREMVIMGLMTEDMRSAAGTIRDNIRAGLRNATKEAKKRFVTAGLIDEKGNIRDEKLMSESFTDWSKLVGDRAIKQLGLQNKSRNEQLIGLANLFSNTKAGGRFSQFYDQSEEISRQADRVFELEATGRMFQAAEQSLNVSLLNVASSFDSLVQRLSSPIEGPLTNAINQVAAGIQGIADWVAPNGKVDPTRAAEAAVVGTGGLVGGALVGKKLFDMFTGIPANTAATAANTAALNRSTAAMTFGRDGATKAAAASVAASSRMGLGARLFAIGAVVEGLWSAAQNVNAESINLKVDNAKGMADQVTRWLFGDDIANRPDMPARDTTRIGEPNADMPEVIQKWNRWVTSFGRDLAVQKAREEQISNDQIELQEKFNNRVQALTTSERIERESRELGIARQPSDMSATDAAAAIMVKHLRQAWDESGSKERFKQGKVEDDLDIGRTAQAVERIKAAAFDGARSALSTTDRGIKAVTTPETTSEPGSILAIAQNAGNSVLQAIQTGSTAITTAGTSAALTLSGAVTGAASALQTAMNAGGANAAAQIRAALSTPVNVNVNTNSGAKPVDKGANTFGPR